MTPCSEPQPAVIDICQPGPNLLRADAVRSREFVSYVRSFCRAVVAAGRRTIASNGRAIGSRYR